MELPCRMVQEAGAWKFDLEGTMERMLGGQLDAALDQVTGALAEGMQGLATAMAEGLNQAFGATTPAEAAPPAETKPTQAKKKKAAKKGHR